MHTWYVTALVAGLLPLVFMALYLYPFEGLQKPFDELTIEEKILHWQARIKTLDAEKAYAELAQTIEPYGTSQRHDDTHAFAKALYDAQGLDGIVVCDEQFSYGCFHEFMLRAVEEEGINSVQELNELCHELLGKRARHCQHGIGHGVLGLLGYSLEDLTSALKTCEPLPYYDPSDGCAGGVFMEYNRRSMTAVDEDSRRFSFDERLEPCASLKSPYDALCAHWIPMWWVGDRPENTRDLASTMGTWCSELPGGKPVRESCLMGIGNRMHLLTGMDHSKTAEFCALLTDNETEKIPCHVGSAMRFLFYLPKVEALQACNGLSETDSATCRRHVEERLAYAPNFNDTLLQYTLRAQAADQI